MVTETRPWVFELEQNFWEFYDYIHTLQTHVHREKKTTVFHRK